MLVSCPWGSKVLSTGRFGYRDIEGVAESRRGATRLMLDRRLKKCWSIDFNHSDDKSAVLESEDDQRRFCFASARPSSVRVFGLSLRGPLAFVLINAKIIGTNFFVSRSSARSRTTFFSGFLLKEGIEEWKRWGRGRKAWEIPR